jgi:phosphoribosylglycinamide formyltransferase 1
MENLRIAVLASGKGSNLRAIYNAIASGQVNGVEIALIISNNSKSGALEFAERNNIPRIHLSAFKFGGDESTLEAAMLDELRKAKIDLIVLAGYMKKLPDAVIEAYPRRILNVHPALLPKYGGAGMYGANVHNAVLTSGDMFTGATVHYVDKEYDTGDIILQEVCEVLASDTPETLARRVRDIEHQMYPKAIALAAEKLKQ